VYLGIVIGRGGAVKSLKIENPKDLRGKMYR
jgi:hypothetical protein